ncbi:hypothetical protein [Epilithonimonas arachidiradicis]|uniref:DUF4142 domain-containing protein n=1 Tax=Epilithonimonas arachidiradicis TaxID=1617282 RepID=A0A420DE77_9FLAO|nr:hypothetical protein [Epilithonimonas arachidiradicis]RKE90083.1 hypothetical protein BXY58_0671 [Epilithonimonas arachidiradicis]GGG47575.1 hypothetical protein GCM10007332_06400 [Epilithonimonas arachidiradicis]
MKLMLSLLAAFVMFFQSSDLEALRDSYAVANQSKENAKNFIEIADKKTSSDPVVSGYKAAAKVLEAKVSTEGKRKALVKSGATSLESLIKSNPNNTELRLIRLSVQENVPKIVGYHKNLKEDKEFVLNNYSKQNAALKSYIKKFAAQSKTMTAAEKATLK